MSIFFRLSISRGKFIFIVKYIVLDFIMHVYLGIDDFFFGEAKKAQYGVSLWMPSSRRGVLAYHHCKVGAREPRCTIDDNF